MLEMFEKLINEHGSSVILKERIALINDKYEALQYKLESSQKENELLKKENEILKGQLELLNTQAQKAASKELLIHPSQQEILKHLFSNSDGVDESLLARTVNLDIGMLSYHLDELLEQGLIDNPGYSMGNGFTGESGRTTHYISKDGRKYVVRILNA